MGAVTTLQSLHWADGWISSLGKERLCSKGFSAGLCRLPARTRGPWRLEGGFCPRGQERQGGRQSQTSRAGRMCESIAASLPPGEARKRSRACGRDWPAGSSALQAGTPGWDPGHRAGPRQHPRQAPASPARDRARACGPEGSQDPEACCAEGRLTLGRGCRTQAGVAGVCLQGAGPEAAAWTGIPAWLVTWGREGPGQRLREPLARVK